MIENISALEGIAIIYTAGAIVCAIWCWLYSVFSLGHKIEENLEDDKTKRTK